jgi:hypothetical protein
VTCCRRIARLCIIPALIIAVHADADPVLRDPIMIGDVRIYADHFRDDVYYLSPMPVRLAMTDEGRPDISLALTYYTGSQVRADADRDDVRWALRIGLQRARRSPGEYDRLRESLSTDQGRPVTLRNLTLRQVPVTVVYAPVDTPADRFELAPGRLEESTGDGTYWTRRTINLALERNDGALLRAALENQGAIMSVAWTYVADGVVRDESVSLEQPDRSDSPKWVNSREIIDSDAIRVEVDTEDFPEVLRIVDLDSMAPPGYPGLSIVCTDFLEDRNDWRYEETEVIVEAEGVTGTPVRAFARFPGDDPEISLRRVAFKYAVRVDRPFRFQIRAFDKDGEQHETDWVEVQQWAAPVMASASYFFDVQ